MQVFPIGGIYINDFRHRKFVSNLFFLFYELERDGGVGRQG